MSLHGRTLAHYGGSLQGAKFYETYLYKQEDGEALRFSNDKEDERYREWAIEDEYDDVVRMRSCASIIWQPDLDEYDADYLEEYND